MKLFAPAAVLLIVAITILAVAYPAEAAIGVAIGGVIVAPVAVLVLRPKKAHP